MFKNGSCIITLANFSNNKSYSKPAKISLNFYHENDSESISRSISLEPYQEFKLTLENDEELKKFFKTNGWMTATADNPHIQGFYFTFHPSGSVSGDHFF